MRFAPPNPKCWHWQEKCNTMTVAAYAKHPALLRMLELEALAELARNGNARIYIGFDKQIVADVAKNEN